MTSRFCSSFILKLGAPLLLLVVNVPVRAQAPRGPLPPPASSSDSSSATPMPASTNPPIRRRVLGGEESPLNNTPPPIPVEQIIQKFVQHEEEFKRERDNYTYTQSFVMQTIDADGVPSGEFRQESDILFTPDGKRYEKITYAPLSTLERGGISMSQQDLDDLRQIQPFVLTTSELPKYNVTYAGKQRLDEISCYVFDVGPKVIEKDQRYFQGRIWVDDKDMGIVKSYGKAVPDIIKKNNENIFPHFETYRENIAGPYWFPTYTHADDELRFSSGPVHIRFTVKYSNYKRFGVTVKIGPATEVKQ
jgi:hypothetical protein